MPLVYSFVARGTSVLGEYSAGARNFSTQAVQFLGQVPQGENRLTYTADGYNFLFVIEKGFTFLIVSDDSAGRQLPLACIDRIKDEFMRNYAQKAFSAPARSLDKTFGPRLKYHMDYCQQNPEEMSQMAAVQKKVSEVKGVMVQNIEKVLERGENLEALENKADTLRFNAKTFQETGQKIRKKMWWQNFKMKCIMLLVLLILIFVIFCIVCFSGGNCFK